MEDLDRQEFKHCQARMVSRDSSASVKCVGCPLLKLKLGTMMKKRSSMNQPKVIFMDTSKTVCSMVLPKKIKKLIFVNTISKMNVI